MGITFGLLGGANKFVLLEIALRLARPLQSLYKIGSTDTDRQAYKKSQIDRVPCIFKDLTCSIITVRTRLKDIVENKMRRRSLA